MPTTPSRVALLGLHLPGAPSADDIHDLATALHDATADARVPGRAVALLVRHHLQHADEEVQAAVRRAVLLLRRDGVPATAAPKCGWIAMDVAAGLLGWDVRSLRRVLRTRQGRRALGWPQHLGAGHFRCRVEACGAERAQFLANLPDVEPPHVVPLPPAYEL